MLWACILSSAFASINPMETADPVHLAHALEALPAMAPTAHLVPSAGEHHVTVYGYIPNWIDRPLDVDFDSMTHVAWFDVGLDTDGNVTDPESWERIAEDLVEEAHEHGTKVHLCVTVFDTPTHRAVLTDPSKRAHAVAALAALVEDHGADGINIDFERLERDLKEEFVLFTQEMSAAVDEVFVATPLWDGAGSYDFDELAAASDGLFIMGYDVHTDGSAPGPVGPYDHGGLWPSEYNLVWSLEDYRTWFTPDDKIIMGFPLYGREWPASSATIPAPFVGEGSPLSLARSLDRAAPFTYRYEDNSQSAWAFTGESQLWYDDLRSLRFKMEWAIDEGIQGIGFWAVGYEDGAPEFWEIVDELTMTVPGSETGEDTGFADTPDVGADGTSDGSGGDVGGEPDSDPDGESDGGEDHPEDADAPTETPGPSAEYRDRDLETDHEAKMGCACTAANQRPYFSWVLLLLGSAVALRRRRSQN